MRSPIRSGLSTGLVITLLVTLALPAVGANDPLREQQWHLDAVSASDAWEISRGQGVTVAVIDTGIDRHHPDLADQVLDGYDATDPGSPPDDDNGHGTLVSGVVGAVAANDEGGVGVAPDVAILPVRVLNSAGRGDPREVADGIRWATNRGADVINLSFVEVSGATDDLLDGLGLIDRRVEEAIREAHAAGAVVVGAAGNDGTDDVPYSDELPMIVTGASDRSGHRWHRSNADAGTLFAPGVDIVSTWRGGRYAEATGTSFAAPIVAAGAAMLLELGVDSTEVGEILAHTAVTGADGAGVDVVDLLAAAETGRAAVANGSHASTGGAAGAGDDGVHETASGDPREPVDDGQADGDGSPDGAGASPEAEPDGSPATTEVDARDDDRADRSADDPSREQPSLPADTADEVAADDLQTGAGDRGPPLVPTLLAWVLLASVVGGHVVVRRTDLLA